MAAIAQGRAEFSARVQRIETRGGGRCEVFNGEGIVFQKKTPAGPPLKVRLGKLVLALLIGAAAVFAAQYAIFALGDLPEEYNKPDYILGGKIALALVVMFAMRLFFNLNTKPQLALSVMGVALGLTAMHNLVHLAPEPWEVVFSPRWVAEMRASTAPGTLQFRGLVYPLG